LVVNLNGRVPDEGAVSEAAIAWSVGRIVVGYKNDVRSLYMGKDNPLVVGLFGFRVHPSMFSVASAIRDGLDARPPEKLREITDLIFKSHADIELGKNLWESMGGLDELQKVASLLRDHG